MPNYIWWSNKIWERFWKMYYMHILKMITFMKWSGYFSIFGFHNFRTKWNCGVLSSEIVLAIPMPNVNLLFRHLITKMQVWGNHVLVKFRYRWKWSKNCSYACACLWRFCCSWSLNLFSDGPAIYNWSDYKEEGVAFDSFTNLKLTL